MGTEVCSKCGKLFFSNGGNLCLECLDRYNLAEECVFDYLRGRKEAVSIAQLHQETKVPLNTILEMFYRGRFIGDYLVTASCEICGEDIVQGKICKKCATELCGDLKNKGKHNKVEQNKTGQGRREGRPARSDQKKSGFYSLHYKVMR